MRFYRRLTHFKAISFDLDDTLYDNFPVIKKAERALQAHLTQIIPENNTLGRKYWLKHRAKCISLKPELAHDVSALRLASLISGMQNLGLSEAQSKQKAEQALTYFLFHRNLVTVSDTVKHTLESLSQHYPLVAISNGNVGIEEIGLKDYFTHCFFAGEGNLQKPAHDMFHQTCEALAITPQQLLHIGDCTHADIYGALQAGCQTVWIDNANFAIKKKPLKLLPTAQLDRVEQLSLLIPSL